MPSESPRDVKTEESFSSRYNNFHSRCHSAQHHICIQANWLSRNSCEESSFACGWWERELDDDEDDERHLVRKKERGERVRKLKMKINVDYIECFEEKEWRKCSLSFLGFFFASPNFRFSFVGFCVCVCFQSDATSGSLKSTREEMNNFD